jgi:hypothetical protein
MDPINMGSTSSYSVFANNPIMFADPLGLDTVSSRGAAKNVGDIVRTRKKDSYWYERKTDKGWEEMGSSSNLPSYSVTAKRKVGNNWLRWPSYTHQDALRWQDERATAFHLISSGQSLNYKGASEEYLSLIPDFHREYQAEQEGRTMQFGAVVLILGPLGWEFVVESGGLEYGQQAFTLGKEFIFEGSLNAHYYGTQLLNATSRELIYGVRYLLGSRLTIDQVIRLEKLAEKYKDLNNFYKDVKRYKELYDNIKKIINNF